MQSRHLSFPRPLLSFSSSSPLTTINIVITVVITTIHNSLQPGNHPSIHPSSIFAAHYFNPLPSTHPPSAFKASFISSRSAPPSPICARAHPPPPAIAWPAPTRSSTIHPSIHSFSSPPNCPSIDYRPTRPLPLALPRPPSQYPYAYYSLARAVTCPFRDSPTASEDHQPYLYINHLLMHARRPPGAPPPHTLARLHSSRTPSHPT